MQWEVREPTTQAEAVSLLRGAVVVMHEQLEFKSGKRTKAWDGDYVEHLWNEALGALKWFEANAGTEPDHLRTRIWVLLQKMDELRAIVDVFWRNSLVIESAMRNQGQQDSVAHTDVVAGIIRAQEYIKNTPGGLSAQASSLVADEISDTCRPILCKRPVAFRVLGPEPGKWELYDDEAIAQQEAEARDVPYQGLYVRDGTAIVAEWQPIKTAPADGFYLVCGIGDERPAFVVAGAILKSARDDGTPRHLTLNWLTHWMPLPAPPQKSANGQ